MAPSRTFHHVRDRFCPSFGASASVMPVEANASTLVVRPYHGGMKNPTEPTAEPDEREPITPHVVDPEGDEAPDDDGGTFVSEPSKLIRIASMTRAMLEEVRASGMDDLGRQRLLDVYHRSIDELRDVLSDDLKEELDSIFVPLEHETPTEPEIRVAQAQLIGWLEGLFQGIQASLWSQQMSAQAQLEQMRRRRALEPPADENHTGLYL